MNSRKHLKKVADVVLRLGRGAIAGALVVVVAGQLMSLITNSCTLVCQPEIAAPFGAITGAIAFFPRSH